jgi:hypothetical protein
MRAERLLPSVLLGTFALLATIAAVGDSVTGDEVAHLPAGYTYVATGNFRLNPQLVKALAALPLLFLDLNPVATTPGWSEGDEWRFGRHFLVNNRAPLEEIVLLARVPMIVIALLTGVFLYRFAEDLWGEAPALFVLFLFAFAPNLLAHGHLVTTDSALACFTLLAVWRLWRFARSARFNPEWEGFLRGEPIGTSTNPRSTHAPRS